MEFTMTKSTLTMTKSSKAGIALIEREEGFETAAILASPSPLVIAAMGTFPLSLIAFGHIRRRHLDDSLTPRPKKTRNATEELESPQEIEIAALTEQIEPTAHGARAYPATHYRTSRLRTFHSPSFTLQQRQSSRFQLWGFTRAPDGPLGSLQGCGKFFEGVATGEQANPRVAQTDAAYLFRNWLQNTAHWSKSRYRLFCVNARYNSASD